MKASFWILAAAVAAAPFHEAGAAPKAGGRPAGYDKYAETSKPEKKSKKVRFVAKVHEPGLPVKYSTYLMAGTDKANAPVYMMMEYDEDKTPPVMESVAADGIIPPGLVVFLANDSLTPTVKGGFPRYMRGEALGRPGRGFPSMLAEELIPQAAADCVRMSVQ